MGVTGNKGGHSAREKTFRQKDMIHLTKKHLDVGLHKVKISDIVIHDKGNSIILTFTNELGCFVYSISHDYFLNSSFFERYSLNDNSEITFRNNKLTNKKGEALRSLAYENFLDTRLNIFYNAFISEGASLFYDVNQYYESFEHSYWITLDAYDDWNYSEIISSYIGAEFYILIGNNPLVSKLEPLLNGIKNVYSTGQNIEINLEHLYKRFNPADQDIYDMGDKTNNLFIEYHNKDRIHNLYSVASIQDAKNKHLPFITESNKSPSETITLSDIYERHINFSASEWNSYRLQILAFFKPEDIESFIGGHLSKT